MGQLLPLDPTGADREYASDGGRAAHVLFEAPRPPPAGGRGCNRGRRTAD